MVNSMWQGYRALDAKVTRASAIRFSDLGTWVTSTCVNPAIRDRANSKYFPILSFLSWYSPRNWVLGYG